MVDKKVKNFIKSILDNMPSGWLDITTHRLDIYDEPLAKIQFLEEFENLFKSNNSDPISLQDLPTAYDYIRLGHPLSCILEWAIAKEHLLNSSNVICFSSRIMPILSVLRENLLNDRNTRILYSDELPVEFDIQVLKSTYGYNFEVEKISRLEDVSEFNGSTICLSRNDQILKSNLSSNIDFDITLLDHLGSVLTISGQVDKSYISAIQHVRRRETIAMTPANSLLALKSLIGYSTINGQRSEDSSKNLVLDAINEITGTSTKPLVASSGLSIQYAILMGLIHYAKEEYIGRAIKIIVPTNCYGGTNDQARRVAACINNVEVVDLAVDGENDMVQSINSVLDQVAKDDAIPYIIGEIPTNPRVEVPNLLELKAALCKERKTPDGRIAIDPVFILDQTFCPNVRFHGENEILSSVRTISFSSGSKFPSGGLCTAGYCVGNKQTIALMQQIEKHLSLCDNEATNLQYEILAKQMPSMITRINDAYKNTREFVNFIKGILPDAKINFVSEELANEGFTPSVFSLDLPTKGNSDEEREKYKRELNHRLINLMITKIPNESKYCVSYGQLKGCYWTIPATSTQGTTKEGDKDYIARVALSPNMDLELHKKVFAEFANGI